MKIIHWTHPTPRKFALATSAIAAADYGITSDVEGDDQRAKVVFFDRAVVIVPGPLQKEYKV